jgi:hypothetical protein
METAANEIRPDKGASLRGDAYKPNAIAEFRVDIYGKFITLEHHP